MVFTAQEILVGRADYPTEAIAENAHDFRQLGLGYANLGALLMALGLPYDSAEGRAWAAAITSLMTGHAYATSARTAARMGPFAGFAANEEHMLRVLRMHRDAARAHRGRRRRAGLRRAGRHARRGRRRCATARSTACATRKRRSWRPTGTICFMLDCDTTGIEPDLGLVKTKKLVGGGTMSIVNQTVPRALRHLGYDETRSPTSSPTSTPRSRSSARRTSSPSTCRCSPARWATTRSTTRATSACWRPCSRSSVGRSARRRNLPEYATVDEIEHLHQLAWELGLKSIAIYRDNCKVGQPLSTTKKVVGRTATGRRRVGVTQVVERIVEKVVHRPVREKLPRSRKGRTFEFRVADCKGFATIGEYDDGRPGEVFLTVSKQGSTLAGIMDAFAKSISYGLQYGVPLRAFVEAFTNMRFEPAGMTDDPEIRFASSVMDYLFRKLAMEYMTYDERAELSIFSVSERMQPTLPGMEESDRRDQLGLRDGPRPEVAAVGRRSRRPDRAPASPPPVPLDNTPAAGVHPPVRRPDVHAVRRDDGPRRRLPRLPELRHHQRLQLNGVARTGRSRTASSRRRPGGRPGSMNHSVPKTRAKRLGHRQHRPGVTRLAGVAGQRPALAVDVARTTSTAKWISISGVPNGLPSSAGPSGSHSSRPSADGEGSHRVAAERRLEDPWRSGEGGGTVPDAVAWTWSGWP